MIVIKKICRYPIKSLAAEALNEVQLTQQGIHGDREWALVSPGQSTLQNGEWVPCQTFERLTIRPEMAAWRATSKATGVQLLVNGEYISLKEDEESMVADRNVSLARANQGYWDHADATISIINLNTIDAISEAMDITIDPARFRANIYIRAKPWSEFEWLGRELEFNDATLRVIRPIDRCKATSVAPGLGDITYNMPAQLARHFGHIYCGVYARVVKEGLVQLNDIGRIKDSVVESVDSDGYIGDDAEMDIDVIQSAAAQATAPSLANWPRSAQVVKIVEEAKGIRSIWLRDELQTLGIWNNFIPGQHVRFHSLETKGIWRTYTVSGRNDDLFRVTIKRDIGDGSARMHQLKCGDKVIITGPEGKLNVTQQSKSLYFITAGIGITPATAMLSDLIKYKGSIRFVHTARANQLALWHEIMSFAAKRSNVSANLFVSDGDPLNASTLPKDSQFGRPDMALIAHKVRKDKARVIICGPPNFTARILAALAEEKVPSKFISSETFASVAIEANLREAPSAGPHTVHFTKSGIVITWQKEDGTLLDLAERHGMVPAAHCRAGICGTCQVNLEKGEVAQLAGVSSQDDGALLCCSVPIGDIELLL